MRPYPLECDELVEDLLADLDRVTEEVRASFGGLHPKGLLWQPGSDRWSVAQCLAHLVRINALYRDRLAPALAEARTRGLRSHGPVKGGWFGRWFTKAVGPLGRRVKTSALFLPRPETVDAGILDAFGAEQDRVRDVIESARGLDLDAVRVTSPASGFVRFHAGDALRMLVEHEKRHVAQAERVIATPGFPRVGAT